MKQRQAIPCIIGMIVGIVIVIAGFCVMNPNKSSIGQHITFGADFYTEIYDVTREVGGAVNTATQSICKAIGWLIVALGAIDFCYFLSKMIGLNPKKKSETAMPSVIERLEVNKPITQPRPATSATHQWRCTNCGKMTATYPCEHCHHGE